MIAGVPTFHFHPELFESRGIALEALTEAGFMWLSHYRSVDLLHEEYGLEVSAIRDEDDAREIERLLDRLFPGWHYSRVFFDDLNPGDAGWKVLVFRGPEGGRWLKVSKD